MKKQITRISIHQTSKVLAMLYVTIGVIFVPVGVVIILINPNNLSVGLLYIMLPFIYGILGYPFAAFMCWAYNFIAKNFGGVEFMVSDVSGNGHQRSNSTTNKTP